MLTGILSNGDVGATSMNTESASNRLYVATSLPGRVGPGGCISNEDHANRHLKSFKVGSIWVLIHKRGARLPMDAEYRQELERRAGGTLSADTVARLLGISRQGVDERRRAGALLAIRLGGDWAYPRAQFQGNQTVPGLAQVVTGLERSGPWVALEFLVTPDDALDGLAPRDALIRGAEVYERVMTLVRGRREGEGFA